MKTKKKNKLLSLLLAVFMMFSVPAYAYVPVQAATTAASSTLKSQTKRVIMVKGQKMSIKPPVKMTYSSDNPKVVYVSSKGTMLARSKGYATVTGKYKSIKWVYKIRVDIPKLSRTSITLTEGKYYNLKVSGTTCEKNGVPVIPESPTFTRVEKYVPKEPEQHILQ